MWATLTATTRQPTGRSAAALGAGHAAYTCVPAAAGSTLVGSADVGTVVSVLCTGSCGCCRVRCLVPSAEPCRERKPAGVTVYTCVHLQSYSSLQAQQPAVHSCALAATLIKL
jgi:hypothetical protein